MNRLYLRVLRLLARAAVLPALAALFALQLGAISTAAATPITSGALTVEMPGDRLEFSNDADHTIIGSMTNNSTDTIHISFWRWQKLPKGWTTSVCFGASCYAAQVDTADDVFGPGETREFILHVNSRMLDHPDSGLIFVRIRAENGVAGDTVSMLLHAVYIPSDTPVIFQLMKADTALQFTGNGPFVVNATYQNRAADNYKFAFHLDTKLPIGWTSGLCIRDSCGTSDITYPMTSLVSQTVRMKIQNTSGGQLSAVDSAIFYLTVRPIGTGNPADSLQYKFVASLKPSSGVDQAPAPANALMLGSIWPNPAATTDLSFTVRSTREAHCSFVLYDPTGKVILQSAIGSVEAGVSTQSVSVRNVDPGAYFARVSDGSALSNPVLVRITR